MRKLLAVVLMLSPIVAEAKSFTSRPSYSRPSYSHSYSSKSTQRIIIERKSSVVPFLFGMGAAHLLWSHPSNASPTQPQKMCPIYTELNCSQLGFPADCNAKRADAIHDCMIAGATK